MKKITTTLLMVLMTMTFVFGQTQKATTENGKKVILNSDGTWKYADTVKTAQTNLDPNDCSNWIKTEEDKVSGKSYTSMKDYLVISQDGGKKGFGINLMLSGNNSIIFSIKAAGAGGCIDKGAKINILFTDGTRMELASDGDFNCKGNATVYFGGVFGKKSQLNELKGKKIDTMRVWTSDSYVEQKFEDDQAEQFKNALNCLTK
ncbi:MAG: hypothetical protein LCH32_01720 [Bacteroidetes bacterium]|nr:hypothetical protein [Bacteroidota bacterium]